MKEKYPIYDVLVVGGGFAGAAAAIAAARRGASVLLIEKYNCLGGAAAFDLVNPFMRYWTLKPGENGGKVQDRVLSRGIFEEIVHRLEEMGQIVARKAFNEEYLKVILNRMALEAGVKLLFGTTVTGVRTHDGKLTSVEVWNVSGRSRFRARTFVDATGDANLAVMAGVPCRVGRESDGLCQPMTLCFRLANVDPALYREQKPQINPLYEQYRAEGKITNPRENVLIFNTTVPGMLHFNTTRVVKLDPTNAEDVTRAELIAREQILEIVDFLRENFTAFANAQLVSSGIQIGARESRMICSLHDLTREEIVAGTKFPDGIAACNYDIDIHSPDGTGTSHYYFPDRVYYTIPYRSLLPVGTKNLIVAGRCVGASHEAQASLRIMPTVCTLGEAAGAAAAHAVKAARDFPDLDTEALRADLRNAGAVVD